MNEIFEILKEKFDYLNDTKRISKPNNFKKFFDFYINNYSIIHREITIEQLKKLSIIEPFVILKKDKIIQLESFNFYIRTLDYFNEDKMIGNMLHFSETEAIIEKSIIGKAMSFCIKNNIDIKKHTQKEFELFEINILS